MSDTSENANHGKPARRGHRVEWDALAAIIAALIGLLSLVVAGYTAYVQRLTANIQAEQVRAQVWPFLIAGNDDASASVVVFNKGVGPAIVREAQIFVDGKPQPDWDHVLDALGIAKPREAYKVSLNPGVFSPGERVPIIKFDRADAYFRFKAAATGHMRMEVCYCSALNQCWMHIDTHLVGPKNGMPQTSSVEQCPKLPRRDIFFN
ncbi:MAG TPA: hypothetical protein VJ727_10065 [Rhodanobacteraceae bacterium]|nr:hypothetical protein [Rhodanobacteraceae bacterium]